MLNQLLAGTLFALVAGSQASAASSVAPIVVTASNTAVNALLIYDTSGNLINTVATGGAGGVTGNAGGLAYKNGLLAVVNFGSGTVSIFAHGEGSASFRLQESVQALASPISVAFGNDHLYVMSTTSVESHAIGPAGVAATADGSTTLILGDGSAAQVGVINGQLIMTEKTGDIESVNLSAAGAVVGKTALVANIPSPALAPFGLVTRGGDAYVTIAHSNEISLVRNDTVLTVTSSGTQNAPCWVALDGPFLFSANSPSHTVSRFLVYGKVISQQDAIVTTFNGNPTDIAYSHGLVAVVDSNGTVSHVSVFNVDGDGNFTTRGVATVATTPTNGIAIIGADD